MLENEDFRRLQLTLTGLLEKVDYINNGSMAGISITLKPVMQTPRTHIPRPRRTEDVIVRLTKYVDCLSQSTPAPEIAAKRSRKQIKGPTKDATIPPEVEVPEVAKPYCGNIMDKFPQASVTLTERLGDANAQRH